MGYAVEYLTRTVSPFSSLIAFVCIITFSMVEEVGVMSWSWSAECVFFYMLYMFYMAHVNEMISLRGMQSSAEASCARPHSRIRSAVFFITGYAARIRWFA